MKNDWLFKVVPFFIAFCFVAIFVWWAVIAVLGYAIAKDVQSNGLQGVVNQVWCGDRGCK